MPNPQLSGAQLEIANQLLDEIRARIAGLSSGDADLLFAYRRKVAKELTYDERGKPMHRRCIKEIRRMIQEGKCAVCDCGLPPTHNVLDRLEAKKGYTVDNTRLICSECDVRLQTERKFT